MQEIFEKLGLFYLGKQVDEKGKETGVLELLKNKYLTTHAAIIGMTGSGKTGLGIGLLEEAAIDKIPAIVIDPKGDMGNLLLAFEDLNPKDFMEWVDPFQAQKEGLSLQEYAQKIASMWRKGIESFHQDVSRVKKLKESAEFVIFTPGSSAGVPLSVLSGFEAPPKDFQEDIESYAQLLSSSASSLLALMQEDYEEIDAVLLANIFDFYWKKGESLSLEKIIAAIITPPFKKIGVLSLESFYPRSKRMQLALKLNNLISSPSFSTWLEGEPLSIENLLFSGDKPKISILYIAHLNDKERMFFVTLLLNRLISWMRRQSGTSALRALLYMDEIFGFFPPNANPPSKEPMLLLLKQARAYGLGIVLSTQNPVDLDYKGLANIGTWFLGRLQTKQDIERVINGLLKSSDQSLEKSAIASILSNLPKRVFLLRSIHKDSIELFKTRWVLSYLKGPLSKDEVRRLMEPKKEHLTQKPSHTKPAMTHNAKPVVPFSILECYDIYNYQAEEIKFVPYLYIKAHLHYLSAAKGVDEIREIACEIELDENFLDNPCEESEEKEFIQKAPSNSSYSPLPISFLDFKSSAALQKEIKNRLYMQERFVLYKIPKLRITSRPNETLEQFRQRANDLLRQKQQEAIDKLQERFKKKFERLEQKLFKAQQRLEKEKDQAKAKTTDTIITLGMTLLDSLFGRKRIKSSTIAKAGSAISKARRAYGEYNDVEMIEEQIEAIKQQMQELQEELEAKSEEIAQQYDIENFEIQEFYIKPRKSEMDLELCLLWRQA